MNTFFVIGRKANDDSAEFVYFDVTASGVIFTPKLRCAITYGTREEAERVLKSAAPRDREGCEVLEVFARRIRTS